MQRTAQRKSGKRSILNKLREMTNVSGIAAEKIFNPEFQRVMDSLRQADNKIRAIVSGQEIEGEDPGDDYISLKDLYKSAKSNLSRREYMTAVAFLGRFHKKAYDVVKIIENLNLDVDKVHHDFLFKDLDDEQKKYLGDMKSRLAKYQPMLVSEAGIMDFLVNVGTERGRALAAWEKRYPRQVGKFKADISKLLVKTEGMLGSILSALKEMAGFRSTRKIDDYIKSASKIVSNYVSYDNIFKETYSSNIKSFLEKQEFIAPTQKLPDNKNLEQQEVKTTPNTSPSVPAVSESNIPVPLIPATDQSPPPSESGELENTYKSIQTPKSEKFNAPKSPSEELSQFKNDHDTLPPEEEDQVEHITSQPPPQPILPPKPAHKQFLHSLQVMSKESPTLLASHIRRYAKSIKETDLETSLQLLKIANNIKE